MPLMTRFFLVTGPEANLISCRAGILPVVSCVPQLTLHRQECLCYWASMFLPQKVAGDDDALDFAGAFVDGDDAGVAVHALDVGFARVAGAAVNLHGFVND